MVAQEEEAPNCSIRGLDYLVVKMSLLKSLSSTGTGCPGKVVDSPSLEKFKRCVGKVLRDMV